MPVPGATAVTVAVKVTFAPKSAGLPLVLIAALDRDLDRLSESTGAR